MERDNVYLARRKLIMGSLGPGRLSKVAAGIRNT